MSTGKQKKEVATMYTQWTPEQKFSIWKVRPSRMQGFRHELEIINQSGI